nr:type IV toxin-antitoxin system AbiEi family antitoxin [uncultured Duganella sp.]
MSQFVYASEQALLSNALEALWETTHIRGTVSEAGSQVANDYAADAVVDLVVDKQSHRYSVECKSVIDRKAQLDQLSLRLTHTDSLAMLVTEYLSKELASHCRSIGLQFIDGHGNAYLRAPGMFVFSSGEKKAHRPSAAKVPRGLTNAAALRVVFALLSKPELLNATYKEIALLSRVALGTAYNVFADLEQRGYLLPGAKHGRRLLEPNRLMEEWVTNFPTTLRAKLQRYRFSAPDPYWWKKMDVTDFDGAWGSEVAAAKLVKHLHPSSQTIYVEAENMRAAVSALVKSFRLRPDPLGEIEIVEKFWFWDLETEPGIAPPLLVYSDLLALMDPRAKETAILIKEKFIEPTFHQN